MTWSHTVPKQSASNDMFTPQEHLAPHETSCDGVMNTRCRIATVSDELRLLESARSEVEIPDDLFDHVETESSFVGGEESLQMLRVRDRPMEFFDADRPFLSTVDAEAKKDMHSSVTFNGAGTPAEQPMGPSLLPLLRSRASSLGNCNTERRGSPFTWQQNPTANANIPPLLTPAGSAGTECRGQNQQERSMCFGAKDMIVLSALSRNDESGEEQSLHSGFNYMLPTQEDTKAKTTFLPRPLGGICSNDLMQSLRGLSAEDCIMPKGTRSVSINNGYSNATNSCAAGVPSLARDEDCNWLSELQCLVRSEILEIFVSYKEGQNMMRGSTNINSVAHGVFVGKVGLRCKHCHAAKEDKKNTNRPGRAESSSSPRILRATAFPSKLSKLYQSYTMMLREHIATCCCIPAPLRQKIAYLRTKTRQSAFGTKQYWEYAALAIGLYDSPQGIRINHQAASRDLEPFGRPVALVRLPATPLVTEEEISLSGATPLLYEIMSQVQLVHLDRSEIGCYRRSLKEGYPGFGCIHCMKKGRMGFSRKFPMSRKDLNIKIDEMYDHLSRCTLCPPSVKEHLRKINQLKQPSVGVQYKKEFLDILWLRLGHHPRSGTTPS